MNLLVTGGSGFIGSAVIRLAVSRGLSVLNIDKLTYAANPQNLQNICDHPNYQFEQLDICEKQALSKSVQSFRPNAIMHLAAESHVDRSIDGPGAFMDTNVIGTFNLLQVAREYTEQLGDEDKGKFRFHHVSTDEVYGDLNSDEPAFTETTPYDPSSPYSASKAASDHLARAWGRTYGLPVLITNCSNNYGPYQFPEKLIPVVILKALHKEPIPVYGKGENIRDWLYVEDHADALLTVLEKGRIGETYNIGGNNERTNIQLVKTICTLMDARLDSPPGTHQKLIEFVKDRPGHDRRYAIDCRKISSELGWEPKVSWDEGFAKTVDWYLENKSWWQPLTEKGDFGQRLGQTKSESN